MKKRLFTGILFIILGLLVAFGPKTIFPVCQAMDGKFMKCHWTAQAVFGIGLSIALLGALLVIPVSKQIQIGINIAIVPIAILVLLIPNTLIGVCGSVHMKCHALTLPALDLLGVLTLLAAAVNVWYLWRTNRKESSL